jgi:hypothetical protein
MKILAIHPKPNRILSIIADDGRSGLFDVTPFLDYEAFQDLHDPDEFAKVVNGGYFIEWNCGADLSSDTIEAHWDVISNEKDHSALQTDGAEANRA